MPPKYRKNLDEVEIRPDRLQMFWNFVEERQAIYARRFIHEQEWPWTDDEILREYKFTNIFRELDTGTIWYRENWREPYADHEHLFFNTCLYRLFNYWPTAEYLGFMYTDSDIGGTANPGVWDPDQIVKDLRYRMHQENEQIFTGAHMITGTLGQKKGEDKIYQVVKYVLDPIWQNQEDFQPQPGDSLEEAFKRLLPIKGFGEFLSYEVVTDLRWTRYLRDAPDILTWANPGPGAMRGANWLFGFKVGRKTQEELDATEDYQYAWPVKVLSREDYIRVMRWLLKQCGKNLSDDFFQTAPHPPEMREIEHSLCEFDKWMRVKTGRGRPRSRYTPPHER